MCPGAVTRHSGAHAPLQLVHALVPELLCLVVNDAAAAAILLGLEGRRSTGKGLSELMRHGVIPFGPHPSPRGLQALLWPLQKLMREGPRPAFNNEGQGGGGISERSNRTPRPCLSSLLT